jgi:hypothetical protein
LINLSIALDSPGFRGLSATLLVFLVILWFINWGFTLWRVFTGVALGIPQQREEEEEQLRKAREEQSRTSGTIGDNESV